MFFQRKSKSLLICFLKFLIVIFNNRSYQIDILFKYFGIIELKYIKREEALNKDKVNRLLLEGKEELNRYEKDAIVKEYKAQGVKLKKIVMVFYGWELIELKEI